MWSKLCRNLRTYEHDEHSCRCNPSRPKSTTRAFDRGDVFVAAQPVQLAAVSSSRGAAVRGFGALSPIPSCLGIGGHPSGSRQGHPRYTGARSARRPWVAHEIRQHSTQCRYTPNMAAEQCRSRARALSVARRSTRTTTTNAEMLTISVCTHTDCAERASTVCSVKCRILRRISTEVRNASVNGVSRGDENRRELLRTFVFEHACWWNVVNDHQSYQSFRGKERCPGMTITYSSIEMVGKLPRNHPS